MQLYITKHSLDILSGTAISTLRDTSFFRVKVSSRRKISFDQEKIGTEMVSSPSGPEKNA